MTAKERKGILKVFNCFAILLIVRIIEEFLIVPYAPINTHSVFSCCAGLVVVLIFLRMQNIHFEKIGLIFSKHKISKGFLLAILLNIIPFIIVYAIEYFYLKSQNNYVIFTAYYDDVTHSFSSAGIKMFTLWIIFGLVASVLHAVFYELTFRGLFMKLFSRSVSFAKANFIQAILYTFWFILSAVRFWAYADENTSTASIVFLFLFFLVYEFIVALKLGFCRISTGAIWLCMFDHLMLGIICDMIHIQATSPAGIVLTENTYIRFIAYQLISLVIAYVYYKKKLKKLDELKAKNTSEE